MGAIEKKSDLSTAGERVLALIRTRYPEYHPILAIADLAHDKTIEDPRILLECHKTIIKHVMPELKSVEVKAELNETRRVIVSMFDGDSIDVTPKEQIIFQDEPVLANKPDPMWMMLEFAEEVAA